MAPAERQWNAANKILAFLIVTRDEGTRLLTRKVWCRLHLGVVFVDASYADKPTDRRSGIGDFPLSISKRPIPRTIVNHW